MAIKRWVGNAAAVTDVHTVSLSGTVASQNYSITINGKSVTYAAGSGDTVATILAGLVSNWNSTSSPPSPEFQELIAAGVPSAGPFTSMTVSQTVPGRPTSISVSTSGAATFAITNTVVATGPNDFENGLNWSGGTAPANSDTLVFDNGSVPCLYNIDSTLTGITLIVGRGYSGQIGLPMINRGNQTTSYNEYRPTALVLAGGDVSIESALIGRCNLAFGANDATVRIVNTGTRIDPAVPAVLITGGDSASELSITRGDVGLAFYQGEVAEFPSINTGYFQQPLADVNLWIGSGAVLATIVKNGGNVVTAADATTISQGSSGGTVSIVDSADVTTVNANAGTVELKSTGTIGTVNLYGSATLNCDGDPRPKTITNPINVYSSQVTITDTAKTVNAGELELATSGLASVNVNHGANTSIVYN